MLSFVWRRKITKKLDDSNINITPHSALLISIELNAPHFFASPYVSLSTPGIMIDLMKNHLHFLGTKVSHL